MHSYNFPHKRSSRRVLLGLLAPLMPRRVELRVSCIGDIDRFTAIVTHHEDVVILLKRDLVPIGQPVGLHIRASIMGELTTVRTVRVHGQDVV